ncbi:MAG: flavodoxin family protein [Candidatus Ranarchaeia archaeon]
MSWKKEKVKILGVNGSPRDEATLFCIKKALESAEEQGNVETHLVDMSLMNVSACKHCDKCYLPNYYEQHGYRCTHNDDMEKIYPHILEMDAILMASPCYAGSISSLTKLFFDRSRPVAKIFSQKLIAAQAIAIGGALHGGQDKVINDLHYIMNWYGMIVIPFRTWYSPHGAKVWSDHPTSEKPEVEVGAGLSGVKADSVGIEAVEKMGERIVWGARLMKVLNNLEK